MLSVDWKGKGEHPIPDNETRERLNKMRKANVLTDMVLMAGKKEFPCHKLLLTNASPMINCVVQLNMDSSKVPTIMVEDLHLRSMENLLNCVYLGYSPVESHSLEGMTRLAHQLQIDVKLEGCGLLTKQAQVATYSKIPKAPAQSKTSSAVPKNPVKPGEKVPITAPKKSKLQPKVNGKRSLNDQNRQLAVPGVNAAPKVIPQQKSLPEKKAKKIIAKPVKSVSEPKAKKTRGPVVQAPTTQAQCDTDDDDDDDFRSPIRPVKQSDPDHKKASAQLINKPLKKSQEKKPKSTGNEKAILGKPPKGSKKKGKLPENPKSNRNSDGIESASVEQNEQNNVNEIHQVPLINERAKVDGKMRNSFSKETAVVHRRRKLSSAIEILNGGAIGSGVNRKAVLGEHSTKIPIQAPESKLPKTAKGYRSKRAAFAAAAKEIRVTIRQAF